MRLGLVSVVGEFLWSGERPVDGDVQCFPGGHLYPPGVLFRVRGRRGGACGLYRFGWSLIAVWTAQKHVPR